MYCTYDDREIKETKNIIRGVRGWLVYSIGLLSLLSSLSVSLSQSFDLDESALGVSGGRWLHQYGRGVCIARPAAVTTISM